jgi:hypothetical protein
MTWSPLAQHSPTPDTDEAAQQSREHEDQRDMPPFADASERAFLVAAERIYSNF